MSSIATLCPPAPLVAAGFLGSVKELRNDLLGAFVAAQRRYGDVVRFRLGPPVVGTEIHALFHPDGAQQVFGTEWQNYRKDTRFYQEIREVSGNGMLMSQDEVWLRQKRFLQPLFTIKRVNGYAEAMADEAARLVSELRERDESTFDVYSEITRLTLRMVVRVLFGADAEIVLPVVRWTFPELGEAGVARALSPVNVPLSWPTPNNRRLRRAQGTLFAACDEIITRRRTDKDQENDFLGMLLTARDGDDRLTDQEVREQVLVFMLAGHETTATALTMAFQLLGQHLDVQERVREEVAAVVGDRTPTADDVKALTYTTMVAKEAMRLYPSAPVVGRRSTVPSELCGRLVPAKADIVVAPWVIHRHPEFWDSPEVFDPERFTPEREKGRHRYAWMPFGGGPRACIGQHFAMLESVIILATLLRAFHFRAAVPDVPVEVQVAMRPKIPVLAEIKPL